jgi:group I intron endonuclease
MIGIYKITNLQTGMCYIGATVNVHARWAQHKSNAANPTCKEYEKPLYIAMREYGIDNFSFEVLQECEIDELQTLEQYWIALYNTVRTGYNQTPGGVGARVVNANDGHPNHKLTTQDVVAIRTAYNNHERKCDVYQQYADRINRTGFHKIWNGATWPTIMPEVYTEENAEFHKHNTANTGSRNGRAVLTECDVRMIRQRKKNGESALDVYRDYTGQITFGSFKNVWGYHNWKNVIV